MMQKKWTLERIEPVPHAQETNDLTTLPTGIEIIIFHFFNSGLSLGNTQRENASK